MMKSSLDIGITLEFFTISETRKAALGGSSVRYSIPENISLEIILKVFLPALRLSGLCQ